MNKAKPKIRLHIAQAFHDGQSITLSPEQSHYLANVLRCRHGDVLAVFNGEDGEWLAEISGVEKRVIVLHIHHQLVEHKNSPDLWLAFAPIKNKTDKVIEKATELGASKLIAVYTRYSVIDHINEDKLKLTAIEAAEQSGRHDIPDIEERKDISTLVARWPQDRVLLYADESGGGKPIKQVLSTLPKGKYGILIGPEGGFADHERRILNEASFVKAFGMGPRILKADTAAAAALACVQAWSGDWEYMPHFEVA